MGKNSHQHWDQINLQSLAFKTKGILTHIYVNVSYALIACVWTNQVKLAYQESEVVALLKKIPLGLIEMSAIRERAEQLRDGNFCDYRPVLPLMLASFIFDVLCTPGMHQ